MTLLEPAVARTAVGSPQTIVTPTIRRATRRWLFWIAAAVFLVILAVLTLAFTGSSRAGVAYSATNAAPQGSMAVAEVLRQRGVDVAVPASFAAAESALRRKNGATLFLYDPDSYLDIARISSLAALATHVVVLTPSFSQLKAIAPTVAAGGVVRTKIVKADCALRAAVDAGSISATGNGYRVIRVNGTDVNGTGVNGTDVNGTGVNGTASPDVTTCFRSGRDIYSVVQVVTGHRTVTVLGAADTMSNEHVDEHGNAALALTLLGAGSHLVWYLPTISDTNAAGGKSIAELTPLWVESVSTLLVITALAAAFWRGRRFGPLVIENLPVVVRASETMEGRARLYQNGAARLRALDALRIGSVARLAAAAGLPRLAAVDEVIRAVAAVTSRDPGAVRTLLLDAQPATDRDLVRLSDALLELEAAVARDIRPA